MRSLLPWILIGLSVAGGLALLAWSVLRPEEEDATDDGSAVVGLNALAITASESLQGDLAQTAAEDIGSSRRRSRIRSMKASLEKSLDTTIGARASTKDRMTMPWFLLVGADGSGKQTVLANNGLALPFGPPIEVDTRRKDAGKWWLFEDAVVLEAPAAAPGTTPSTKTLAPEQTVADASVGWHTLIHMLRRERPDSPLNGIIVTISCADLLGGRADPEKLADEAERIRAFLERTGKLLGVRLPLHVLVTKCDTLPGFRTFAQTLPEARRDDIFGWANPHHLHATFDAAWVDEAFGSLRKQLVHLRDEMLAALDEVSDTAGVFVFDAEFGALQEPLKAFVAGLVTAGERRPSLFFRGAYFTGDALDPVPDDKALTVRSPRAARESARSSEFALSAKGHRLVFLRSLFEDKIFKEAGLARPMARFRLARDRRVVAAQAAAILLLVGGSFGLWRSVYGWRRDAVVEPGLRENAQTLTRVLSGLAIDLESVNRGNGASRENALAQRRARDAAVIELVGQMRDLPSTRVRSAFLPSSWFSSLPKDIRTSMMRGVQSIVLPVIRERLQERSLQLLGPEGNIGNGAIGGDADPSLDPASLATYLSDVRTLSRNIERYNSLASPSSGSVAEMSALLDYLFSEGVSNDTAALTRDFEKALIAASGPPILVTPRMVSKVLSRAVTTVSTAASAAGRRLAPRTSESRGGSRSPQAEASAQADLDALMSLASLINLVDPRHGLVATVSDSTILGVRLARLVQDSVEAQLRFAATRIRSDTLSPSAASDSLKRVVGDLFKLRLMARVEGGEIAGGIRANQRLRWDVGRLEMALAMRGEFVQAALGIVGAFPGQAPQRMARALEVQLRARVLDVAASAQRFTPGTDENMLDVRAGAANLEAAGLRIARLAALLDTLGAAQESRSLVASAARQAEHTLATAQALVDRQKYFAPQTARMATWQGVIPISYAALGVVDSLSFFTTLINHTTDIRTLAHDLGPALKYLRSQEVDSVHDRALLARWEALATSVGRYERGDYTSSLGMLWRYLREDMAIKDVSACAAEVSSDLGPVETDFFGVRRRQFHAAMLGRCRGGSAEALAAYARIRALFGNRLAGRFPFVDPVQAQRAQDADPAAVRDLMRQYDAFLLAGDAALRSDPRIVQSARGAIDFLDQLAAVRTFMAPFVENVGAGNTSGFSLVVRGGPDDEREVAWRFGDSVHVSTAVDSLGNEEPVYFRGGWAPLRYVIQRRDSSATIRFFHPWTKVELAVPSQFPTLAPDIFIPRLR